MKNWTLFRNGTKRLHPDYTETRSFLKDVKVSKVYFSFLNFISSDICILILLLQHRVQELSTEVAHFSARLIWQPPFKSISRMISSELVSYSRYELHAANSTVLKHTKLKLAWTWLRSVNCARDKVGMTCMYFCHSKVYCEIVYVSFALHTMVSVFMLNINLNRF